jgi:hypothetical protein
MLIFEAFLGLHLCTTFTEKAKNLPTYNFQSQINLVFDKQRFCMNETDMHTRKPRLRLNHQG